MSMKNSLVICSWCEKDDQYRRYHDEEWGVPVANDSILFEFIVLESAQAGLSWWTVLKKRENYRRAFAEFAVEKVALFSEHQVEKLMQNSGYPDGFLGDSLMIPLHHPVLICSSKRQISIPRSMWVSRVPLFL